jgi:hypothetical protein
MVFCHEWQQAVDGGICAIPLTYDLKSAKHDPMLLFKASQASWAKPLKGRAPGSYVTDGPFLYRTKDNTLIMLWSSFGETNNYCIGTAVSESGKLEGPWRQDEKPVYSADGGHGMLFTTSGGDLYLAIHTPNRTPNERAIFAGLHWQAGRLVPTGEVIS